MDEAITPIFSIGHHETHRPSAVSAQTIHAAHIANYDMVTSPITNSHFHTRVLALLSSSLDQRSLDKNGISVPSQNEAPIQVPPLSPADTPLTPDDSMSQIIAVTCDWSDLCSPDPVIADISRQILKLELTYAAFCGITYVLIPGPRLDDSNSGRGGIVQFARAMLDALSHGPFMQIYIWLPMVAHHDATAEAPMGHLAPCSRLEFQNNEESKPRGVDIFGTWAAWDIIRSLCKYNSRLCIALALPKLLPPVVIQARWYSEPVRILTLEANIFVRNFKGYPTLSKAHQALIRQFVRLRIVPWFLLCNVDSLLDGTEASDSSSAAFNSSHFPTPAEAFVKSQVDATNSKHPHPHLSYMRNLQNKQPAQTQLERFGAGYQDYLQAPLQPLTVNLESITYEVFEKDPIKYEWYEKAIARALHDWIEQGKPTSDPDGRVVVAVVGAGRGPLVTRALRASEDVGVEIDMWALEKNPNAFVLLQRHNASTWGNRVNLVESDMRTWKGPIRKSTQPNLTTHFTNEDLPIGQAVGSPTQETFTGDAAVDRSWLLATAAKGSTNYKVDILISELLGSFADNELSPECLDGVQHLLNPIDGISIPASYTAHLTPISAPKLHADIITQSVSNPNAPETPYVVMLNAIDFLSTASPVTTESSPIPASTGPQSTQQGGPTKSSHHKTNSASNQPVFTSPPASVPLVKQAWSFEHPNPILPAASATLTPSNAHNVRSTYLTFPVSNRGTCHGLAGYFETVLYGKVELSTNPITMDAKSEGMISWFPIYFPLKIPISVPDDSEIAVSMWRQTDDRRVWYEWMVNVYAIERLSSTSGSSASGSKAARAGRRIRIGGSDLHSSIKEACLM